MSIQALTWVIYDVAPDIKHADFRTLLVLADHADPQGMGAYPSRSTISRLTGYSVRTVSYALKSLESSGLISRGDQRIVSNLGGYKPTVWNLNMGRGAIVIGLAAVIIGEVLGEAIFRKHMNFIIRMLFVIVGGILYYIAMGIVLWLKMPTDDTKLFTAIIVAIFLAVPYLQKKRKTSFKKVAKMNAKNAQKEG